MDLLLLRLASVISLFVAFGACSIFFCAFGVCSIFCICIIIIFYIYSAVFIEFGSPSGAASNLGLTIVTFADFSDYDGDDYGDFFNNVLRLIL